MKNLCQIDIHVGSYITPMAGLEELHPSIQICQTFGAFPFRMEIDTDTKRLKQLLFSLFHPVTYWHRLFFSFVYLCHPCLILLPI